MGTTTHLQRDDVLSGKGFISQQIFKRFGLNVELLHSLSGHRSMKDNENRGTHAKLRKSLFVTVTV